MYYDSFVQEELDPACPNPYELIDKYSKFLEEISFGSYATETHLDTSFFEEVSTAVHDETVSREGEMLDPAMMGDFDGK